MHYHKQSELDAETQKNEAVFIIRMVGICDDPRVVIEKRGFSLVKGNTVFPQVLRSFPSVPFERELRHSYIVTTMYI
jgi:hypothetical protein